MSNSLQAAASTKWWVWGTIAVSSGGDQVMSDMRLVLDRERWVLSVGF